MISENEKQKTEKIIDNFKNITQLNITYLAEEKKVGKFSTDGQIKFSLHEKQILRNIEYTPRISGNFLVSLIIQLKNIHAILLTDFISPKTAQLLRENDIQYIDGSGNAFINDTNFYVFIDGNKLNKADKPKKIRVFQASGLKCLFYIFINPLLINQTQKEIKNVTGLSYSIISYVFQDLKRLGYLIEIEKGKWELINRKKLLERWLIGFEEILRPSLLPKNYQFVEKNNIENWKNIFIETPSNYWGGEPAGDLLTDFLIPEKYTLYTRWNRQELMQKLRILPLAEGNIEVLNCFWDDNLSLANATNTAPILLVYADLVVSGDSRNYEIAQRIYEKYLSDFFERC